jgi:hypothetical protein
VFLNQKGNAYEAPTQADIRNAVTNAESDAARSNGYYANVTQDDIRQGISPDNTTLTLPGVTANDFCIQGVNTTDNSVIFNYRKSTDDMMAGAAGVTTRVNTSYQASLWGTSFTRFWKTWLLR